MKIRLPKNRYVLGLVVSLLLIIGPALFALLLNVPSLIYPNDCDIALRCEHAIIQIAASLGYGVIFLGPVLMLLGTLILIVIGFIWGVSAFKRNSSSHPLAKYIKQFIGIACCGIMLYFLYIPSGPDQCSRVVIDTQYEVCLEKVFADMTVFEARQWLVANDFTVGTIIGANRAHSHPRDPRHANNPAYGYDLHFQAYRDFGKFRSVPYGTNINRIFARIGPAPDRFELNIYGDGEDKKVVAVDVWWAFSFL